MRGTDRGIEVQLHQRVTWAAVESGWSTPRPSRFSPGKEKRYPFYMRLDEPWGSNQYLITVVK